MPLLSVRIPFSRSQSRIVEPSDEEKGNKEEEREERDYMERTEEEEEEEEEEESYNNIMNLIKGLKKEMKNMRREMETLGDVSKILTSLESKIDFLTSNPPSPVDISQQEPQKNNNLSLSRRIKDATVATGKYAVTKVFSMLLKAVLLFLFLLGAIYLCTRHWGFSLKKCCLIAVQATAWLITGGTGIGKVMKLFG